MSDGSRGCDLRRAVKVEPPRVNRPLGPISYHPRRESARLLPFTAEEPALARYALLRPRQQPWRGASSAHPPSPLSAHIADHRGERLCTQHQPTRRDHTLVQEWAATWRSPHRIFHRPQTYARRTGTARLTGHQAYQDRIRARSSQRARFLAHSPISLRRGV